MQVLAATGACVLAVGLTYLPSALHPDVMDAIDEMRDVSTLCNSFGHPFVFEDRL